MTAVDFFLYDNRTWSPRLGRDWGLKAATGVLGGRADLKADFDRYCGAMPGDQGQLSGFGSAVGGLRSRLGAGYLLCVTVECVDSFGRPSWAVFGLWCPDRPTLGRVLSPGDPVGSARAVLAKEAPQSILEILPAAMEAKPRFRRGERGDSAIHRFDRQSTVREVVSILLGAVQKGVVLPNVLGITSTSRLIATTRLGFDLVYCDPLDDRTERALLRVQSAPESDLEEILPPAVTVPVRARAEAESQEETHRPREERPARPFRSVSNWLLGAWIGSLAATVFAIALVLTRWQWNAPPESRAPFLDAAGETSESNGEPRRPVPDSAGSTLEELGDRLQEFKGLDPDELRRSLGFVAAESQDVLPQYQTKRDHVRAAYSELLEIRDRMVRPRGLSVAYYFDDADGSSLPRSTRLAKVAEILATLPSGRLPCVTLREAFGLEFENGGSVTSRWCESLGKLEAWRSGLK